MLITKVVVVVMGLVAVVPKGSNEGATFLLRDAFFSTPRGKLAAGTECPVGLHLPLLQQAAGECKGDCSSFNLPAGNVAAVAASMFGMQSTASTTTKSLYWIPASQELAFTNLTASRPSPHDRRHWFELGAGTAKADADCLGDAIHCPIVARLEMGTGGVKACTLTQHQTGNAGFASHPFEYVDEPETGNPLAESYAIELTTSITAPLRLKASNFAGGRPLREAELYPDTEGKVVLVLSNLPLTTGHAHAESGCEVVDKKATLHSAVVYDLADGNWPPGQRVVPHLAKKANTVGGPDATCKGYLDLLTLPKFLEYPSDPKKCKPPGTLVSP